MALTKDGTVPHRSNPHARTPLPLDRAAPWFNGRGEATGFWRMPRLFSAHEGKSLEEVRLSPPPPRALAIPGTRFPLTRTVSALQGATRMQISIVIADAIRPHIPCIFSLSGRGASTSQLEARLPVLVCWRRRSTFCRIPRGAPPMMTWCAACAPRSHTTLNKTEFQNKQMPCKVIPMLRCETAARSHIVSPHNY